MSLFKRSWYSVIRKPIKSIILGGMLYGISVFLMIAVAIYQQQSAVQNEIRNQVGASFRLEISIEDSTNRIEDNWDIYGIEFEMGGFQSETFVAPNYFSTIFREDIEKISQVDGISEINISATDFVVNAINFESIKINNDENLVNIRGILNLHLLEEISHEFITLKDGRWIEASDINQEGNVLVISEDLAKENSLNVGDEIDFEWQDSEPNIILEAIGRERREPIPLSGEIVGIFSIERPMQNFQDMFSMENTIFSNLDLYEQAVGTFETYLYTLATFHVEDVDVYEQIQETILNLDINWERYNLVDANEMLERLSTDFSGLEQISTFLFSIGIGSGFVILWLIFIFWIRNRTHEIAILLSIGVEKIKIITQFTCEALWIAFISFGLCFVTLPLIPRFIDSNVLSESLQEGEILMNGVSIEGGGNPIREHFYEQALTEISIPVHGVFIVMGVVVLLIILSVIVATIPIIRMKPKDIFSKLS